MVVRGSQVYIYDLVICQRIFGLASIGVLVVNWSHTIGKFPGDTECPADCITKVLLLLFG